MFNKSILLLYFFVVCVAMILSPKSVFSQTLTQAVADTKANDLQEQIKQYQEKITDLQSQTKTLSSQVKVADSQIQLTELKIQSNQQETEQLTKDIDTAAGKVAELEGSLGRITKALFNRVTGVYRSGSIQSFQVFFSSKNISDAFSKLQYLKIVQKHDRQLVSGTVQAQNNYQNEKTIFEDKKQKVETLHKQLDEYNAQLTQQKQEKQELLSITKNSESEYQKKLAEALRELQQIQKAAIVLVNTEPKDVKRGDPIGLMGNSGYSSGPHLHFGIYNYTSLEQYNYYGAYENPANNLQGETVSWDTGCSGDPSGSSNTGSGVFAWPMSTNGLKITQGYGITCWSWMYKGNPHPAFDIVNNGDITVRAVEDGKAYACRNCTGDGANGVFLFHSNGKMSLYWHLQ